MLERGNVRRAVRNIAIVNWRRRTSILAAELPPENAMAARRIGDASAATSAPSTRWLWRYRYPWSGRHWQPVECGRRRRGPSGWMLLWGCPSRGKARCYLAIDRRLQPVQLHLAPRCATGTGDVKCGNPGVDQQARRARNESPPPPTSFTITGTASVVQTFSIRLSRSARPRVPLALQDFLRGIQMEDQPVGAGERHKACAVFDRDAVDELNGAEVGEERDVGCVAAHLKRRRSAGGLPGSRALTRDPSDAGGLSRRGQVCRLISPVWGVPPVIDAMSKGKARRWPRNVVEVSTAVRSISGKAWCTKR